MNLSANNNSLAPWTDTLPTNWQVQRLGTVADIVLSNVDKHTLDGELPVRLCNYTDVYKNNRITSAIDFMNASALPREIERFRLQKDDVLATKDSEDPNDIAVSSLVAEDLPGVLCGYHLAIIRPDPKKLRGPFLAWVQASKQILAQFEAQSVGVTRFALGQAAFKEALVPLPPDSDQHRIAAYLDKQTAKIDRLMALRRRQMELLKEQRAATIQQAVTRGLDSNMPRKDSGLPWLGEIPKHWDCAPMRRFWDVIDCKHVTVPFLDVGFPVASVMEVRSFDLDLSQVLRTSEQFYNILIDGGRQPHRGDVIYCRNTANTGTSAFVSTDEQFAIGQDVCLIKSNRQNGRFLIYVLHSTFMSHQLHTILVGSTFKRVNVADIKSLIVVCPPKDEQDKIVDFIETQAARLDALFVAYDRQLKLLAEFRAALIHECITGQRRVTDMSELVSLKKQDERRKPSG